MTCAAATLQPGSVLWHLPATGQFLLTACSVTIGRAVPNTTALTFPSSHENQAPAPGAHQGQASSGSDARACAGARLATSRTALGFPVAVLTPLAYLTLSSPLPHAALLCSHSHGRD